MEKIIDFIKDILFPRFCYSCKKEGYFLCRQCVSKIKIFETICYICKGKNNDFSIHDNCLEGIYYDKVIILFHYKNKTIKKLITDGKYYKKKDIFKEFSENMVDVFFDNELIKKVDDYIVIPVPMYFLRKWYRGYNQSEVIAKSFAEKAGLPYSKNIIKRIKNTRQQSHFSKRDRLTNLVNSFKINEKHRDKLDKKTIVLVDDVISTGTTVNEISKILKSFGVERVIVLCIASN